MVCKGNVFLNHFLTMHAPWLVMRNIDRSDGCVWILFVFAVANVPGTEASPVKLTRTALKTEIP